MRSITVGVPCNVWRGVYSAVGLSGAARMLLLDVAADCGVLTKQTDYGDCDVIVAVDGYATRSRITEIKAQGIPVIEDGSLSQWPTRDGAGRLTADICVFSLQSNKLLSCGEGGLILTDDAELAGLLEASVCDGRRWLDGLVDEPVLMGFNGMMSDAIADRLGCALEEHEGYLADLVRGADSLARLLGADAVPGWVERELVRAGRFFALPFSRAHAAVLREHGLPADDPPGPPDGWLTGMLAQLPVTVDITGEFAGARTFAGAYTLTPHWNVAAIGREGS
jgi:hypothetical protein